MAKIFRIRIKNWKLVTVILCFTAIGFMIFSEARNEIKEQSITNKYILPPGLIYRLTGKTLVDEFGHSVAPLRDLNNDGYNEILIGAPNEDLNHINAGSARVFSGKDGSLLQVLPGDGKEWHHGSGVGAAGDIDKDGTDDIIVGMKPSGKTGLGPGGGARVFSGRTSKVLYFFAGDTLDDKFGQSVAGVGDVNRDGWNDIIIGAPGTYRKNIKGYARVHSGKDGTTLHVLHGTPSIKGDRFGFAVNGAGDINGDGYDDLLVGATGDADNGFHSGGVYVFSGKDGRILYRFTGEKPFDELGHSVSQIRDLDSDGYPEIFAGTFNPKGIGYARVFSSIDGRVLFEFYGDEKGDAFGHSVAGVGDVDGDGVDDLLVGAADASLEKNASWYEHLFGLRKTPGYARVYSGANGFELATFKGQGNKHIGYVVSGAGDINNDGFADMLIGSTVFDDIGEVWVVSACAVFDKKEASSAQHLSWHPAKINEKSPQNPTGQLKITGFPANSKGHVNACLLNNKERCSGKNALFSIPFEILADNLVANINFSPKKPEFSGIKVSLVAEVDQKIFSNPFSV